MGYSKVSLALSALALAVFSAPAFTADTCPSANAITSKWDLWARGTCLRGANLWQKVIDADIDGNELGNEVVGPTYDQANLNRLAATGANYANLSFPGLMAEKPNAKGQYVWREDIAVYLDKLIERARQADLYVVISFRTGPGRSESGFGDDASADHSVWKDSRPQAAWAQMWKKTAARYRNHANVVGYDLMVEPNANDVLLKIWEPDTFFKKYKNTTYDWNPFARKLIAEIRTNDKETPVLVGGMNYSSLDWLTATEATADPKVVYAVHNYEPTNYSHQIARSGVTYPGNFSPDGDSPTTVDKKWLAKKLSVISQFQGARRAPVAVNEFGAMRWARGADQYFRDSTDLFETMGVNHAVWLWETSLKISWDEFNFKYGPSAKSHADVNNSALLQAIRTNWSRNHLRPSQTHW